MDVHPTKNGMYRFQLLTDRRLSVGSWEFWLALQGANPGENHGKMMGFQWFNEV
jgi:hypothetical protein